MRHKLPRWLSLGAGVQSSTLALMLAYGELPPVEGAIFADTQNEPRYVYKWLTWLEAKVKAAPHPFPIIRATEGNLEAASLVVRRSKKSGRLYLKTMIPYYILGPKGEKGMLPRKCTGEYKVRVIQRELKIRMGLYRKPKPDHPVLVTLIGISQDEAARRKESDLPWIRHEFPLLDRGLSRADCLAWMRRRRHPRPPKSSCVFCPYHSDAHWAAMKARAPAEFRAAVRFESKVQRLARRDEVLEGKPFLHPSRVPLDRVRFNPKDDYDFDVACEGMCGL